MASKKTRKTKSQPRGQGPRCPRCEKPSELYWHGRRELCSACIDAIRSPLEKEAISFGSLMRGTLALVRGVGAKAATVALLFQIPAVLLTLESESGPILSIVWGLVFGVLPTGMILDLALQHLESGRASLGTAARGTLRRWFGLWLAWLVSQLIIQIFALALVVPGVLRALSYAIVLPLIVDDDAKSVDALYVSKERMRGHRKAAFFAFLALFAAPLLWAALNHEIALAMLLATGDIPKEELFRASIFGVVDALLFVPITLLSAVLHLKLRTPTPA